MSLLDNPLLMQNLGLGLLTYAAPGPRQNFGQVMSNSLMNYAQQKRDEEERLRRKRKDERDETRYGMDMHQANYNINKQAEQDQLAREAMQQDAMQRNAMQSIVTQNQGGRGLDFNRPMPPVAPGDANLPGQQFNAQLPRNDQAMRQQINNQALQMNPYAIKAQSLLPKEPTLTDTLKANEILQKTKLIDVQTQKAMAELESLQNKGDVPDEKLFDMEQKIRKEYQGLTKNIVEASRNFNTITSSAADSSGAGDVALVTSFMKMLDPGSVVRETEFATAANTSGLYSQLKSYVDKQYTGKFLTPEQRTTFGRLARKYFEAAKEEEKRVRQGLMGTVEDYRLDPFRVFGNPIEIPASPTQPQAITTLKEGQISRGKINTGIGAEPSIDDLIKKYGGQ